MGFAALYPSYAVVPAKAGTHNHRLWLWQKQAVVAEHATKAWGYGSRVPATPRGFAEAGKPGTTWGEITVQLSNSERM